MSIWRTFDSPEDFDAWHEQAKAALNLPRVGVNALTGEPRPDAQQTTTHTALARQHIEYDEHGEPIPTDEPALDAVVAEMHRLEDAATLIRADLLTPEELAALAEAFPAWRAGEDVDVDELRSHAGRLYRCVQAHTTQAGWEPTSTPALWVDTAPPDVIPEWRQPTGAHDAYQVGDLVTHKGSVWESIVNANVWEPGVYGWVATPP